MAAASRNEFKLIGPSGTEKYNRSAVTLTCRLPSEISADNLEIRWFKETDCVCVYKNRQVTEGRGYEGRVSLSTQELERDISLFFLSREIRNASLKLKDCKESDFGHYLCQVTDGDRTNEITVAVWPRTPPEKDDECLYISQRHREWTEDERMKMKISASQIDHLRDRFERMGLRHFLPPPSRRLWRPVSLRRPVSPTSSSGFSSESSSAPSPPPSEEEKEVSGETEDLTAQRRRNSTDGDRPYMSGETDNLTAERRRNSTDGDRPYMSGESEDLTAQRRRNSTDGDRPYMSGETEDQKRRDSTD